MCVLIMFLPDVVIPESPEAYVKLTEQTLRSSTGRQLRPPAYQCLGPETTADTTPVACAPAGL